MTTSFLGTRRGGAAWLAVLGSSAALLAHSARAQTIAITGGTVYPVSGPAIPNGTVVLRDGKIAAVGARIPVPAGAQRIDATGKFVTPGLIDAATQLGLVEIGAERNTNNVAARGTDQIAASFRGWEGFNTESVLIAPTRNEGITSVVVAPSGGLIGGQAAVMDLVPGSAAQMLRRGPVAMVAQIDNAQAAGTTAHGETLARLRALLDDTRFYMTHRDAYDRAGARELGATRSDLEAMIPVVQGRLPLVVAADQVDHIDAALALARQYGLKLIIAGGAEAWLAADRLAAARVPVLTGAMNNIPTSYSTLNQRQENAALLRRAGVPVAIIGNSGGGDEEVFNIRNVKYEAGNAVAYGMSRDDALRAVTLTPAELFGVADRVGSLQPGRDANIVIWSGDPFEFSTRVERVLIHGRDVMAPSRQDMLTDRYKTLPPSYRATP